MEKALAKEIIKELPREPGVYLYKSEEGEVLYVGKATSLRSRVGQYFSGQEEKSRGYRMRLLTEQTQEIEIRQTDSVLEALILEATLIKEFQPKYNIDGKDDKSYSFFVITKEEYPRVLIVRETDFVKEKFQKPEITKGKKFGPYTSKDQMYTALKIIRRIFPFHERHERSEKGCLDHQIGLCPGPFAGKISQDDYKRNMRNISLFLSGHKGKILKGLEVAMRKHAKAEEFEEAELCKRQIYALTHINDVALISRKDNMLPNLDGTRTRLEAYDISHLGGEFMVASMVVFVNGEADKKSYRKFKIKAVEGINDVAAMREVIARRLGHLEDWGVPTAIILDGGQGHINMCENLFKGFNVPKTIGLLSVAKGPTRKKVDVYQTAKYPVAREIVEDLITLEALREEAHRFAITFHKQLRAKKALV